MKLAALWLALAAADSGAFAADLLRRGDSCSAVVAAMDSGDRQQVGGVAQYLTATLEAFDAPYIVKKRGSIVDPLSNDGLINVISLLVVRCRRTPMAKVYDVVADIYDGLRGLNTQFGQVK